jgi:hypothetical protein
MPYIRRDKSSANPKAQVVYADPETEKTLLEAGFTRAAGAPYYNYGAVNVVIFDDGTWEPEGGTGFLADEWQKMRGFAGVQLEDFVVWLKRNYQFISEYCANLKPEDYRKEEAFTFVKVYKIHGPSEQEYAWFIQHFTLLGSDGVIPADKNAVPRQYWFTNEKYYESKSAFAPTGQPNQFYLSQTPNLKEEMTDPYVVQKIKDAFAKHAYTSVR